MTTVTPCRFLKHTHVCVIYMWYIFTFLKQSGIIRLRIYKFFHLKLYHAQLSMPVIPIENIICVDYMVSHYIAMLIAHMYYAVLSSSTYVTEHGTYSLMGAGESRH